MQTVNVSQFTKLSPAALRLAESRYVLEKFIESCSVRHDDTLFLLTTYFDAFLFCYVSIEEMVDNPDVKNSIRGIPIFMFFKALRNVATHHSVLSGVEGKFPRPITRIVQIGAPTNAVFCVVPEKVEHIFSELVKIRPSEKNTLTAAKAFLDSLVQRGGDILVHELMADAIEAAEPHVQQAV